MEGAARHSARRDWLMADPLARTRGTQEVIGSWLITLHPVPWSLSNFGKRLRILKDLAKLDFWLAQTACFDWTGGIWRRRGVGEKKARRGDDGNEERLL